MTPKLLLRIAAVLIFIHCFLHTIGFSGWKHPTDPLERQVVEQMTGHKFPFMGASHSLGDYYDGFGYACSIALFLIAAILFIIAADLPSNVSLSRKIVLVLSIALLVWGVDELIFFFPFAAGITLLACVCSFVSFYLIGKQKAST
jgi:hypothetical protein